MNSITTLNMAPIEPPIRLATVATIDALNIRFSENCSTTLVMREQHGRDESSFTFPPPDAVVFAE
jgi:D-lactate dehydrogenase (cytochrome)